MNDLDILKQLYAGNHLEEKDLERATKLLCLLKVALDSRVKRGF